MGTARAWEYTNSAYLPQTRFGGWTEEGRDQREQRPYRWDHPKAPACSLAAGAGSASGAADARSNGTRQIPAPGSAEVENHETKMGCQLAYGLRAAVRLEGNACTRWSALSDTKRNHS